MPMRRPALVLLLAAASASVLAAAPKSPWAGYKAGSFVKTRTVTVVTVGAHKVETTTEITQSVMEVKGEHIVIETTATMNGVPRPTRTRSEISVKDVPAPAGGTVQKSGAETVTVAGRALRCQWTELQSDMAGNKTTVRTWTSPDVPGGVVKTTSRNALMESTLEVVAFEAK